MFNLSISNEIKIVEPLNRTNFVVFINTYDNLKFKLKNHTL